MAQLHDSGLGQVGMGWKTETQSDECHSMVPPHSAIVCDLLVNVPANRH
jgi:hypothetical protein